MSRFYKTTPGKFKDNVLYQPNIEMAERVLAQKEGQHDELMGKAQIFKGELGNVNFINYDAERERVQDITANYENDIDGLTQKILDGDPNEYHKHQYEINQLRDKFVKDKNEGDLFDIESRHSAYSNWTKTNKENTKDNPGLFNRLNSKHYQDIVERGTKDSKAKFNAADVVNRPDIALKYKDIFEEMKANSTQTGDGKFIYNNEELTEEKIADVAWNLLTSDPNYTAYAQQMHGLGDEGFYDDKGQAVNPYQLYDKQGNEISVEAYNNLGDKSGVTRGLNAKHAFHSDLSAVSEAYSYSKQTSKMDPFGMQARKTADKSKLQAQKNQANIQLEGFRQQGKMGLLKARYALMGDRDKENYKLKLDFEIAKGDIQAKETKEELIAVETLGKLGNPTTDYKGDYQHGKIAINIPNPYSVGTLEHSAHERRVKANEFAKKQAGDEDLYRLSNGVQIRKGEYFEFLNGRPSTEELAHKFMTDKGVKYTSHTTASQSFLGEELNESSRKAFKEGRGRQSWTPGFLKNGEQNDWDFLHQAGEDYNTNLDNWYKKNYSGKTQEVQLDPITDTKSSTLLRNELSNNPDKFYVTNEKGETISGNKAAIKEVLENEDWNSEIYVTSANAHNQMGMAFINKEGDKRFIFPGIKEDAEINLVTGIAKHGVNDDSQFYKEMVQRDANRLMHSLNSSGINDKSGTQHIITKVGDLSMSIEKDGAGRINVRKPGEPLVDINGVPTKPFRTFDNMQSLLSTYYSQGQAKQ